MLFRRPHVEYLNARYLNKEKNAKEDPKHILRQLHNVQFYKYAKTGQGMNSTINTAVQDFGINLENMYIGNGLLRNLSIAFAGMSANTSGS